MQTFLIVAVSLAMLLAIAWMIFVAWMFRLWMKALLSGVPVSMFTILGMKLRGNPAGLLVDGIIQLHLDNVTTDQADVEKIYMRSKSRVRTSRDLVELVKQEMENQTSASDVAT